MIKTKQDWLNEWIEWTKEKYFALEKLQRKRTIFELLFSKMFAPRNSSPILHPVYSTEEIAAYQVWINAFHLVPFLSLFVLTFFGEIQQKQLQQSYESSINNNNIFTQHLHNQNFVS